MPQDRFGTCLDCGEQIVHKCTKNGKWIAHNLKPEERNGKIQFITHGCQHKEERDSVKVTKALRAGVKLTKKEEKI